MESGGELLITILSSQAQEESRNISENTRWGLTRRFENGQISVNHKKFLGYTKDEDGNLVIDVYKRQARRGKKKKLAARKPAAPQIIEMCIRDRCLHSVKRTISPSWIA